MSQQQDSNQNELTRNNSLSVQAGAAPGDRKLPNDKSTETETGRKPSRENIEKPVVEGERTADDQSGIDGRPTEQI